MNGRSLVNGRSLNGASVARTAIAPLPIPLPIPLYVPMQRSLEARAAAAKGGDVAARATIRKLFEQKVMLGDAATVASQIKAGVCERICEAQQRLQGMGH